MKIDFDQIRELLALVTQTEITELTVETGDQKITVKKAPTASAAVQEHHHIEIPSLVPVATKPALDMRPSTSAAVTSGNGKEEVKAEENKNLISISSPMVGTFYRSPSPTAPAYVEVGDRITVGQTVCIIEAMKLMNDLPSEISGKIVKICVENGTTVEYGQEIFLVDPNG